MKAGQTKNSLNNGLQEVLNFFHSFLKVSKALNISPASVYSWVKNGKIPAKHAIKIEKLTKGKIKAVDII